MKIISLGAGVQSSTLYLLSSLNILPRADVAIFADTGAEPDSVYEYLEYLKGLSGRYGIPIETVSQGSLKEDLLTRKGADGGKVVSLPFYVKNSTGGKGMISRYCTYDYKIAPVRRRARQLMKEAGETEVEMWIGISLDETQRMKDANVKYITNTWPLIDLRWTRHDCLNWFKEKGFKVPPRSACTFCPFHSDQEWQRLKDNDKKGFAEAVAVDKVIREPLRGRIGEAYLHKDMLPLDEVVFTDSNQLDLFGNDCEGFCGV